MIEELNDFAKQMCNKADYEWLCIQIKEKAGIYEFLYGEKPNTVIIGRAIYNLLRSGSDVVCKTSDNEPYNCMFGMLVTVDYDRSMVIEVGHIERKPVDESEKHRKKNAI